MQHLTIKAAAATTDQGFFSAIAAAYTVDRVAEQVVFGAFEKTIGAWKASGKRIPVHWDHMGEAENVIGYVDPMRVKEIEEEGLFVEGQIDLKNSDVAKEAWRSMKNNAVSLSFGYIATKTRKEKDVTKLLEIDLFEISIVPAPANADTRLLSLKSVLEQTLPVEDGTDEEPSQANSAPQDPLIKEARELILREAYGGPLPKSLPAPEPEPEPEPIDLAALQNEAWSLITKTSG